MAPGIRAKRRSGLNADANAVEFERNGSMRLPFLDVYDDSGFAGIVEAGGDSDTEDALLTHQRRRIFFFYGCCGSELLRSGVGERGEGIFQQRGGGCAVKNSRSRLRRSGDDAGKNSVNSVRNGTRERLALLNENDDGGVSGAVEAAVNADGEDRGIGHQFGSFLIFDGFGAGKFGSAWLHRGILRRGGAEGYCA